jgi:hypothetical protein
MPGACDTHAPSEEPGGIARWTWGLEPVTPSLPRRCDARTEPSGAPFVDPLRRVAAGETVVEASLIDELLGAPHIADPFAELTVREREVLARRPHVPAGANITEPRSAFPSLSANDR